MSLPLLSFSSPLLEAPAGEQGSGGGSAAKAQPRSGLSLPPIEDIAREKKYFVACLEMIHRADGPLYFVANDSQYLSDEY